jgi:carboxynorspermidine decarboxylase
VSASGSQGGADSAAACSLLDLDEVPTPCFVVDTGRLRSNLAVLGAVQERSGAKVLLALKGFAMFSVFPICREYLAGTSASSLWEARLGREEFGGEVHACAPAYRPDELGEFLEIADHLTFNSFSEWRRHRDAVFACERRLACAIRVNPEYSEVSTAIYNPCAPCSRLGVTRAEFREAELGGITGLHFHTLCEQNSDVLERTLAVFEDRFGPFLPRMEWVNFGGGHHVTRADYDVERLVALIARFRARYGLEVYLEPGEAIALHAGVLVASVLDIVHNGMPIAILDTSASAHMPDVLEMPYRPSIRGSGRPGERPHTYRLGGLTCLAGDVIGDYSFAAPLEVGQKLVFEDMAHYTMVKDTTFNGVRLPSIAIFDSETGGFLVVRSFTYEDFRNRLS